MDGVVEGGTVMRIGFTGTREGMTAAQRDSLNDLLEQHQPAEVHHGECQGADAQFHEQAFCGTAANIIIHPPTDDRYRAYCVGSRITKMPPKPYLERNHDIVNACDLLIACPKGPEEQRSGTWATIRFARKVGRPVTIIWPNGIIFPDGSIG